MFVVGLKSVFKEYQSVDEGLSSESIEIRAVGGGVERSSVEVGIPGSAGKSGGTLAKSVARYSLPVRGSNSCFRVG